MDDQITLNRVAILEGILAGNAALIAGVPADLRAARTPCPNFDVTYLINHLIGFMRRFETTLGDRPESDEDPTAYVAGGDPSAEYAGFAAGVLAGWRDGDPDGVTVLTTGEMPRSLVYCVLLLESVVHGWDLAKATGQAPPYSDEQTGLALEGSVRVVQPQYRGEGKNFGQEVAVNLDASSLDKLVAFTGRDPGWTR